MSPHTCVPCVRSIQRRRKKVTKERATPSLRPLRGAKGQTCGGAAAGCAVELTALRCSFVQTSTASQSTRHVRFDAHAHPTTAPPQAQPAGVGSQTAHSQTAEQPFGPLLRSARAAQRVALAPAIRGRAQRWPVWMFCSPCPCGCAEERRVWRIRARVCLSDAQRRELSETPPNLSTAGCPVAKRRGRRQWGRLSFGYFSLAKQRKVPRTPGDSRLPHSTRACHPLPNR